MPTRQLCKKLYPAKSLFSMLLSFPRCSCKLLICMGRNFSKGVMILDVRIPFFSVGEPEHDTMGLTFKSLISRSFKLLIKDTDDKRNIFIYNCSFSLTQKPF